MNTNPKSKFRFASFSQAKTRTFEDVPTSQDLLDSNLTAATSTRLAVILASRGPGEAVIFGTEAFQRFDNKTPRLVGHKRPLNDLAFSPFSECTLATSSDDGTVGIWSVAEDVEARTPILMFQAHTKKVTSVRWSPTAENLLLTSSNDGFVKLWDLQDANKPVKEFDFQEVIQHAEFNFDGSQIVLMLKDSRQIVKIDALSGQVLQQQTSKTTGIKPPRVTFCGQTNCVCVTGGMKNQERLVYFLDENFQQVGSEIFQQSSSQFLIFWDENSQLLHCISRGSTEYFAFEYENGSFSLVLSLMLDSPVRGACMSPTRSLKTEKTQIAHFFILNSKNQVYSLSLEVQSKIQGFNKKFYNVFEAPESVITVQEFLSGCVKKPIYKEFVEGKVYEMKAEGVLNVQKVESEHEELLRLRQEVKEYKLKVEELEGALKKAGQQ